VSGETAKFLKEKFEEFKKSFKNILNLKWTSSKHMI
jgi:hypothetical protein